MIKRKLMENITFLFKGTVKNRIKFFLIENTLSKIDAHNFADQLTNFF